MDRGVFHYKGFGICTNKQGGVERMTCTYGLKYVNLFLPRSFTWLLPHDTGALRQYIDALVFKDVDTAAAAEAKGHAVDMVYAEPDTNVPIIQLVPERIISILRGEEPFEVAENAQIQVRKRKDRSSFYAWMAGPEAARIVAEARAKAIRPLPVQAAPVPVREIEVLTRETDQMLERITVVTEEKPYFIRRLFLGTQLIWAGTSFNAAGPWKVYQEETEILAALGISA